MAMTRPPTRPSTRPPTRPPVPPSQRTARNIVVGAAAGIVVLAIVVAVVALTAGSGSSKAARPASATAATTLSSASAPSRSVAPTTAGHGATAAVIEQYLGYINSKNVAAAQKLICAEQVTGWKAKIHAPGGDFTLAIKTFAFAGSEPGISEGSVNITYNVTVRGASTAHPVTFTMISQNGPKICGEQYG
jgi:hypothetical protein